MSMHKSQPYYVKSNNLNTQKRMNTMIYYLFPHYPLTLSSDLFANICEYCPTVSCSYSLYAYLSEIVDVANTDINLQQKCDALYPYNSLPKVTKLNVSNNSYEIIELYQLMGLSWENYPVIESLHFGNSRDSIDALQFIRKNKEQDLHYHLDMSLDYSLAKLQLFTEYKVKLVFCQAYMKNEYDNAIDLLLQLCLSFQCQMKKGSCIIKYGDTFSDLSLQIFILLSHFYEKVYVVKPSICRMSSSEKYIVCKNFRYEKLEERDIQGICSLYERVINRPKQMYIRSLLNIQVPLFILSRFEEINSIFCQPRLEHLYSVLCNHEKLITENGPFIVNEKCKEWCKKIPTLFGEKSIV